MISSRTSRAKLSSIIGGTAWNFFWSSFLNGQTQQLCCAVSRRWRMWCTRTDSWSCSNRLTHPGKIETSHRLNYKSKSRELFTFIFAKLNTKLVAIASEMVEKDGFELFRRISQEEDAYWRTRVSNWSLKYKRWPCHGARAFTRQDNSSVSWMKSTRVPQQSWQDR